MTQIKNKYGYRTRTIQTSIPGVIARWLDIPNRRGWWDGALVLDDQDVWVLPATKTGQLAEETEIQARWWANTVTPDAL